MIRWIGTSLQDSMYKLKNIIDLRANPRTGHWEVEVQWLGFSPEESTWEPLATIFEDAPEHVREFLDSKSKPLFREARKTLPPLGRSADQPADCRLVRMGRASAQYAPITDDERMRD
eukprot:GHVU01040822.1.p2 GENE.GHVU01040822.1~~GHVU01040822.1.p2  ORF type:complete len:117 (-),score=9.31 GHVU01040822.1:1656-2006(-)